MDRIRRLINIKGFSIFKKCVEVVDFKVVTFTCFEVENIEKQGARVVEGPDKQDLSGLYRKYYLFLFL